MLRFCHSEGAKATEESLMFYRSFPSTGSGQATNVQDDKEHNKETGGSKRT